MKLFNDNEAKQINVLDERFYESAKHPGVYYPSVTTILDAYPKGFLIQWYKEMGFNADVILEQAAESGSKVHNAIEMFLAGQKVTWEDNEFRPRYTLQEWQMICKFIEFWETYKPEMLVNEFTLVSDELKFGGTIDLISKINNEIWLIDFKTSNSIYKTHELQLSAYTTAWNTLNPDYKIQRTGILWLKAQTRGTDKSGKKIQGAGWQLKEFERPVEECFKLFQHTQAIWNEENPNYRPKNQIYPSEFMLKK